VTGSLLEPAASAAIVEPLTPCFACFSHMSRTCCGFMSSMSPPNSSGI